MIDTSQYRLGDEVRRIKDGLVCPILGITKNSICYHNPDLSNTKAIWVRKEIFEPIMTVIDKTLN